MLHKLVEIDNGAATASLFLEEHLQLPQLIECTHVWVYASHRTNQTTVNDGVSIQYRTSFWVLKRRIGERDTHRVRSICEGRASRSGARRASERSTSRHPGDCSNPEEQLRESAELGLEIRKFFHFLSIFSGNKLCQGFTRARCM